MTVVTVHGRVSSRPKRRVDSVPVRRIRPGIRVIVGGTSTVTGSRQIFSNKEEWGKGVGPGKRGKVAKLRWRERGRGEKVEIGIHDGSRPIGYEQQLTSGSVQLPALCRRRFSRRHSPRPIGYERQLPSESVQLPGVLPPSGRGSQEGVVHVRYCISGDACESI